jgi:uncharacterized protein YjbJ (UPF0337 family)
MERDRQHQRRWRRDPPTETRSVGGAIRHQKLIRLKSGRQAMNWDTIKGDWKQFKGKVKEQWGKLTDDELDRIQGRRDQLAGAIQKRYGIAKDEAERQVKEFEKGCSACEESTFKHAAP